MLVGIGMVAARPLAGAHTWAESMGGLVLSVAVLAVLFGGHLRSGERARADGNLS